MQIGPYLFTQPLVLSPMAGITDRPFRTICRRLGADLAVSEMVTSDPSLWKTAKSRLRMNHCNETTPRSVQIAGADPLRMAEAARFNIDNGAEIIDINMGCPAKKVCNVLAGSALLKDEILVGNILEAVVNAVNAPVTLKTRTGWNHDLKNGLKIAHIAEQSGIQSLAIHGRTRADAYNGHAEYDTIREIKSRIGIPVLANGDIDSPEKAKTVLDFTGADGLLIGRAAQGNPWIFREIRYYLSTGRHHIPPSFPEIRAVMLEHLEALYNFYGDYKGVRIARKHIGWYLQKHFPAKQHEIKQFYRHPDAAGQYAAVRSFLDTSDTALTPGTKQAA